MGGKSLDLVNLVAAARALDARSAASRLLANCMLAGGPSSPCRNGEFCASLLLDLSLTSELSHSLMSDANVALFLNLFK